MRDLGSLTRAAAATKTLKIKGPKGATKRRTSQVVRGLALAPTVANQSATRTRTSRGAGGGGGSHAYAGGRGTVGDGGEGGGNHAIYEYESYTHA